jgi:hypothetical protein
MRKRAHTIGENMDHDRSRILTPLPPGTILTRIAKALMNGQNDWSTTLYHAAKYKDTPGVLRTLELMQRSYQAPMTTIDSPLMQFGAWRFSMVAGNTRETD